MTSLSTVARDEPPRRTQGKSRSAIKSQHGLYKRLSNSGSRRSADLTKAILTVHEKRIHKGYKVGLIQALLMVSSMYRFHKVMLKLSILVSYGLPTNDHWL